MFLSKECAAYAVKLAGIFSGVAFNAGACSAVEAIEPEVVALCWFDASARPELQAIGKEHTAPKASVAKRVRSCMAYLHGEL